MPAAWRRWVAVLLMALALPWSGVAFAQSSPRAAEHDGFGRMVFDWDAPVRWSAETVNSQLVVRFEKPISGDPRVLLRPLARYLKGVTVSPDRKMVTFPLAVPVQIKSFITGNSVVVDLVETKGPVSSAAPPPPPSVVTPPPSKPAGPAQPAPAPVSAPAAEAPTDLVVRGGEHTGFNRLVFDWPKPVGYTVDVASNQAVISFDRPAALNVVSLRASLPADVTFMESRPAGRGTAVVLALPPEMRVRHFTSGPKVAMDLVRPAGAPPPPRAAGSTPPPLAPALGSEEQPPAMKPLAPQTQPTPPSDSLAKPDIAKPDPGRTEPDETRPARTGKTVSLGFPFDQPTGAAVFRRAGWLWAVFDRKAEIDVKLLKRSGGDVVQQVEQVQTPKGSAVRLLTRPGFNPSLRKDGQLWVLDLAEQPLKPQMGIEVGQQFDFEDRGRLVLGVADAAAPVPVRDPEVGDLILAVPVTPLGVGVRTAREHPQVELLPTAQGIAVIPRADGVRADVGHSSVEVSMPGGLHMSRDAPRDKDAVAMPTGGGPMEISRWLRGGPDKFYDEHKKLLGRLSLIRPEDRNTQRLEIARHYVANGFGAEALGVLRTMATAQPEIVDAPAYRAVRGAANFLMNRDDEAIADLSLPALSSDPGVNLFLSAARMRREGDPARHALSLRLAAEDLKGWPRTLRMAIGPLAVKATIAAGDPRSAAKVLDAMSGPGLSRRDTGALAYLGGLVAANSRQPDAAIARFRDAEASESRPDRAYAARDRVELMLKLNRMTISEAIRELERLRFAWRGENFEYELLKRLGQLQIANGQYGDGLRTLRALVSNHADNADVPNVVAMMADAFERLYLGGEADRLPPVVAIGLYDEFQELTPAGTKGDEMIRRLADRLAAVDLLDRAADLLRHQVGFRLAGAEKARVGARLAFLELSDRKPAQALESLDMSEMPDLPGDLYDHRRYLRVQTLDDLGRTAEALAMIINDQGDTARRLRAEIYWRLKRWADAATALETIIDKPSPARPLDARTARRVLDLATALTLAKDERGLQRIRRTFGAHMAATDLREAFELLTSEPERGIIDYRRVGEKIKQVQDFQTFMGDWRNRVRAEGLSSLN